MCVMRVARLDAGGVKLVYITLKSRRLGGHRERKYAQNFCSGELLFEQEKKLPYMRC